MEPGAGGDLVGGIFSSSVFDFARNRLKDKLRERTREFGDLKSEFSYCAYKC